MDWTLNQIYDMNQKQLKTLLIKLYSDKIKYETINEFRNAFIIYAFNENDLKEADSEYVESDNFEKFINKANSAQELRDLINSKPIKKIAVKKNKGYKLKIYNNVEIVEPAKYGDNKEFTININDTVDYHGFEYRFRAAVIQYEYDENRPGLKPYLVEDIQYLWYSDEDEYRSFLYYGNSLEETVGSIYKPKKILDITE